jgi:hypothetical protein
MKDPANSDRRYFVPVSETVFSRPVWISPQRNMWADVLMSEHAGLVNRHYHPHHIFAYTISGKWGYLEHDWTATAGDFVYETPGESHTLIAYECAEPMKVFFVVRAARLAGRGRQQCRHVRRARLYRRRARPLCLERHRRGLCRHAVQIGPWCDTLAPTGRRGTEPCRASTISTSRP